jgi:hypothetical protein
MELDGPASFLIMGAVIALRVGSAFVMLYYGFRIAVQAVWRLLVRKT